jgi:hypothetical protein
VPSRTVTLAGDDRAEGGRDQARVTVLGREIVDAVSIAAVTTAILVVGRDERSSFAAVRYRRPRSRLATASALGVVALVAAAGVVALFGLHRGRDAAAASSGAALPGDLTGLAPWPANTGELRARLGALGLPALQREGAALHIHQHLDVFVHGRRIGVPAGIGIAAAQGFVSPLHTHDASGIVHIESPDMRTFTLGELFGVWGVRLTRSCVGGYCASGADRLRVDADGTELTGDPRLLPLAPHAEIVVAFGAPRELPRPLPTDYAFPPGL